MTAWFLNLLATYVVWVVFSSVQYFYDTDTIFKNGGFDHNFSFMDKILKRYYKAYKQINEKEITTVFFVELASVIDNLTEN